MHPKIVWNFNTKQSFCTTSGRTSDQVNMDDARADLDQFDCQLPYVETVDSRPGANQSNDHKSAYSHGNEGGENSIDPRQVWPSPEYAA